MPVEITNERAPVTSVVITDTKGHRCVKILRADTGAMVEHDPDHFVGAAFLDPPSLRSLAAALIDLAVDAEARITKSARDQGGDPQ